MFDDFSFRLLFTSLLWHQNYWWNNKSKTHHIRQRAWCDTDRVYYSFKIFGENIFSIDFSEINLQLHDRNGRGLTLKNSRTSCALLLFYLKITPFLLPRQTLHARSPTALFEKVTQSSAVESAAITPAATNLIAFHLQGPPPSMMDSSEDESSSHNTGQFILLLLFFCSHYIFK